MYYKPTRDTGQRVLYTHSLQLYLCLVSSPFSGPLGKGVGGVQVYKYLSCDLYTYMNPCIPVITKHD